MGDKVLVIGSGGREHAICRKLLESDHVEEVLWAPGNAAAHIENGLKPIKASVNDFDRLISVAKELKVSLVVAGPEAPLAEGAADIFKKNGILFFGPSKDAARLEASKIFTKELCKRADIPTAEYEAVDNIEQAAKAIKNMGNDVVVKADGLAAGKGVFVCDSTEQALSHAKELLLEHKMGKAGKRLVIERKLKGTEASFMCLVDKEDYVLLPTSKDHKRLLDGDKGPNTGGMGAFSPSSDLDDEIVSKVENKILKPLLSEMAANGTPYTGAIYLGLMLVNKEPFLLEVNVRLGDPETQVLLPRIEDDLYPYMKDIASGSWKPTPLKTSPKTAVCVVLASEGYPSSPQKGQIISGIDDAEQSGATVFHAGTAWENGRITVAGGRVLGVTTLHETMDGALEKAYRAVDMIKFDGKIFRKDIGIKRR